MSDLCNDNRFELIEKYKKKLIEATNIETAPDEMAVLDNILFRFWQMGWLDKLELPSVQPMQRGWICPVCGRGLSPLTMVCPCNNGKGWEITCKI